MTDECCDTRGPYNLASIIDQCKAYAAKAKELGLVGIEREVTDATAHLQLAYMLMQKAQLARRRQN